MALLNPAHRREEGIKWWPVSYTMAMFSFVTVYTAMYLHNLSMSFIDNRQDLHTPFVTFSGPLNYQSKIPHMPLGLLRNVMFNLNNWLADGLLVSSLMPRSLSLVPNVFSAPRSTVATLSTPQTSGLSPFPASCTLPRLVRIPPFHTPARMLRTNPIDAGMGIVTLYFQYHRSDQHAILGFSKFGVAYLLISVSLNVLITLMIVVRLILHARNVRTATGSLAEISGLCKTISTMFIESCALFTVSSLVLVGALAAYIYSNNINIYGVGRIAARIFFPILAEIQVRAFPT